MITLEFFASRTIFFSIGTIDIYWYGLLYVVAFWGAWYMLPYLGNMRGMQLSRDEWTSIVAWGALGVLVGGRVGYALFYEPVYFLQSPLAIFSIWNGGMSSHGGFIGAALGVWWAVRIPLLSKEGLGEVRAVSDVITVPVALGLALGRIGNIINQEFGIYPYYEAVGDVALAIICYLLLRFHPTQPPLEKGRSRAGSPPFEGGVRGGTRGIIFAIFLLLYSILRFSLEFTRAQEWPLTLGLSRGQLLTIPLFIVAVILFKNAHKRRVSKEV